jgi:hypothetical protein
LGGLSPDTGAMGVWTRGLGIKAGAPRHGHLPEREIVTGLGPVAVRCPRVRDRAGEGSDRIRFSSAILPPYARRSKSLEVLIPILYLKGVSTGDFGEALVALPPKVILGIKFADGIEVVRSQAQAAA